MIVVHGNVLAYLFIPGRYTSSAEHLLESDSRWAAPRLWQSELRNVLANHMRSNLLEVADAVLLFQRAKDLIATDEYEVETSDVLRLSKQSKCSAYNCGYIALAEFLDLKLVTADATLSKAFPECTRLLSVA